MGRTDELASRDVLTVFGARIGRDTAVYLLGTAVVLPVTAVSVAVFTRYLPPAEYGHLAVLFTAAGLLTTIYNLGSLQGVMMWVFGSGEGGEDMATGGGSEASGGSARRALTVGMVMTLAIVAVATVPLLVFAGDIGDLLVGSRDAADQVALVAASAGVGAVFRLAVNVVRMERRPVAFSVLNTARPVLAVASAVPLLMAGGGIEAVLIGTIAGTTATTAVILVVTRRSYALAWSWSDVRQIWTVGSRYVAVVIGLWIVHSADVFILSRFAPASDVGLYRVASRIAAFLSYFVSAFLMAWGPLERSPLFKATYDLRGRAQMHSLLTTYYVLFAVTMTLGLGLASDVLVRIAAPEYRSAAHLIPAIGAGFVFYGAFVVLARITSHPRRDLVHGASALAAAAMFVAIALLLVPGLGGYGAALAMVLGMTIGCAGFIVLQRRCEHPVPIDWPRIAGVVVLAVAVYTAVRAVHDLQSQLGTEIDAAAFLVVYPALLVALRLVPRAHVRTLARIGRSAALPRHAHAALAARLALLDPGQRILVLAATRDGLSSEEIGRRFRLAPGDVEARIVSALRELLGRSQRTSEVDGRIGHVLVGALTTAERDAGADRLSADGVTRVELHELDAALDELRQMRRSRRERKAPGRPPSPKTSS